MMAMKRPSRESCLPKAESEGLRFGSIASPTLQTKGTGNACVSPLANGFYITHPQHSIDYRFDMVSSFDAHADWTTAVSWHPCTRDPLFRRTFVHCMQVD